MLEIYNGSRLEPPAFSRFQVSLGSTRSLDNLLEDEIRQRHSYKSFQQPENIAEAIRLISDKELWKEVGNVMDKPAKDIKQELSIIVDRRNKIAHEADINPEYDLGDRWNINEELVNDAVDFIEQVVESIHSIL